MSVALANKKSDTIYIVLEFSEIKFVQPQFSGFQPFTFLARRVYLIYPPKQSLVLITCILHLTFSNGCNTTHVCYFIQKLKPH